MNYKWHYNSHSGEGYVTHVPTQGYFVIDGEEAKNFNWRVKNAEESTRQLFLQEKWDEFKRMSTPQEG